MATFKSCNNTSFWCRAAFVGVLATCARVWLGPIPLIEQAHALIPDSGLQRKQILDEARRTNQLLGELKQILTSYTFNVRLQGADNPRDTSTGRTKRG